MNISYIKLNLLSLFFLIISIAISSIDFKEKHIIRILPSGFNSLDEFFFKEPRSDRNKIAQAKSLIKSNDFHYSFIKNNDEIIMYSLLESFVLNLNTDNASFYKDLYEESLPDFVKIFTESMLVVSSEKTNELNIVIDICSYDCAVKFSDMIEKSINTQIKKTFYELYKNPNFVISNIKDVQMNKSIMQDRILLMENLSLSNRLDTIQNLPIKTDTYLEFNIRIAIVIFFIFIPIFYLVNKKK